MTENGKLREVDRPGPLKRKGRRPLLTDEERKMILSTRKTGKAISIPMRGNAKSMQGFRQNIYRHLILRGVKVRTRTMKDDVVVWMER